MQLLTSYLKPLISVVLIIFVITSYGQTSKKDLLIGKWQFEKFISEYEGSEITTEEEQMIKDANRANKGLILTFSNDNKFKSEQKGGMEINNSIGKYTLLPDNRIVIMEDTIKIERLDNVYFQMYQKGRPTIVFKRI